MASRYGSPPGQYNNQLYFYPFFNNSETHNQETCGAYVRGDVQPVADEFGYPPYATPQQTWQGVCREDPMVGYSRWTGFSPNTGNNVDFGTIHLHYQQLPPTNHSYSTLNFGPSNVESTPQTLGSGYYDPSGSTPIILDRIDWTGWRKVIDATKDIIENHPSNDEVTISYVSSSSFNRVLNDEERMNKMANSASTVRQEDSGNREQTHNSIVPRQEQHQESADQRPFERALGCLNPSFDEVNQPNISMSLPILLNGEQQHQPLRSILPPYSDHISLTGTLCPSTATSLVCDEPGCDRKFTGRYRKGNLTRHKRHKHRNQHDTLIYSCEVESCRAPVFHRSDALLRHYRNDHPGLKDPPVRRRKLENHGQQDVNLAGIGAKWTSSNRCD